MNEHKTCKNMSGKNMVEPVEPEQDVLYQQRLFAAAEIKAVEQQYARQDDRGTWPLMQRAGQAAYQLLHELWPQANHIVVLIGKGNNGGDGLVLARLAQQSGLKVDVMHVQPNAEAKGDAAKALDEFVQAGGEIKSFSNELLKLADVLVDGLLGTGISGKVNESYAKLIQKMNQAHKPILALDLPSGLDADTGCALGIAMQATATIQFVGLKQGLFTGVARDYCGEMYVASLSVPATCFADIDNPLEFLTEHNTVAHLHPRPWDSHKGRNGHVVVLGGNQGMVGAPILAALSAARSGAGLVKVATMKAHHASVMSCMPEAMTMALDNPEVLEELSLASILAVGPGLGQDDWSVEVMHQVLSMSNLKVVDADALRYLAKYPQSQANWVLTPHPGEAAELLKISPKLVQKDRFSVARAIQQQYGGVCVLKGCGTIIASDTGINNICWHGNPGMAVAGMGDVLTGLIAALLAQGLQPLSAAQLGVWAHSMAGDLVQQQIGTRGFLARDVIAELPIALNQHYE